MHVEVQVALNFLISFLYNKLPRRRVNQLGEELEKTLKQKFQGHWYPEKPFKGSAYRCIKTAPPLEPAFETAARESGMDLSDIQDNLPEELSIWIDPGEVSYRLGEKGAVKILYSDSDSSEDNADREISRTFNPEAQCFKPIDSVASQMSSLSLSGSSTSPFGSSPSPTYKSTSPIHGFIPKTATPLTFTTATFAQTKFGSTKLKSNSKRSQRMSPTEFSSYIKQRAIIQQHQQLVTPHPQSAAAIFAAAAANTAGTSQRPRSLSPNPQPQLDPSFLLLAPDQQFASTAQNHFSPPPSRSFPASGVFDNVNGYLGDLFANSNMNAAVAATVAAATATTKASQRPAGSIAANSSNSTLSLFFDKPFGPAGSLNVNLGLGDSPNKAFGLDGMNFNMNAVPYPNQYQHLLVAN